MKKKKIVKSVLIVIAAVIVPYTAYQVYLGLNPAYKTQVALIKTVEDTVPATGIVVRDETVINTQDGEGVYNYLIENGDKVAKGSQIAEIYADAQDAVDSLMLAQYQNELDILKRASDQGRTAGTNIDSLTTRIGQEVNDLSIDLARGEYSSLESHKLQLMELLNSYDVASGNTLDIEARMLYLEQQIAELQQRDIAPTDHVTAPGEGYFISTLDGMETLVDKASLLDMSIDEIASLVYGERPRVDRTGNKLVSEYKWYYAAVIDAGYAGRFQPGMSLMLDISYSAVSSLSVNVVAIKTAEDEHRAVVIVECDLFNAAITELRFENASFSFRNYKGFIIDRAWLHMEAGVLGVYVKYGATVQFRRIDIIFETEDYIVSRADLTDSGLIALYDEIITEGRDLYVGKDLGP